MINANQLSVLTKGVVPDLTASIFSGAKDVYGHQVYSFTPLKNGVKTYTLFTKKQNQDSESLIDRTNMTQQGQFPLKKAFFMLAHTFIAETNDGTVATSAQVAELMTVLRSASVKLKPETKTEYGEWTGRSYLPRINVVTAAADIASVQDTNVPNWHVAALPVPFQSQESFSWIVEFGVAPSASLEKFDIGVIMDGLLRTDS